MNRDIYETLKEEREISNNSYSYKWVEKVVAAIIMAVLLGATAGLIKLIWVQ